MKKSRSNQNVYETLRFRLQQELKHLKHQKRLLKFKLFLLVILPTVLALLAAKTAQVWLRIKLREVKLPDGSPVIKPIQQETMSPQWISPEPLSNTAPASDADAV